MVILGFPGVQALDLVGPFEVFTGATICLAGQGRTDEGYSVRVVTRDGEPATTLTGLALVAQPFPDPREPIDTLVLPGGIGVDDARRDPDTVGWVKIAAEQTRRVVSVCTGAFLAAQSGLIDGCVATTHWAFAGQLAREFPSITVDPEPIFVQQFRKGLDGGGCHGGHRPGPLARRGRLRHRRRADGRPLAGDVSPATGWTDAVRRPGVDATRQAGADP